MALNLYAEVIKKRHQENPSELLELDEKLGGIMDKCPDCCSPMLIFATRWRQGYKECICPVHGLVLVDIDVSDNE